MCGTRCQKAVITALSAEMIPGMLNQNHVAEVGLLCGHGIEHVHGDLFGLGPKGGV